MAAINLFTRFVKNSLQAEFGHKICSFIQFRQIIKHIIIQGNPRVYKALKNQLEASCAELQRIKKAGDCTPEFLDILNQITLILKDMKENTYD